jgi:hypothetical protein
VLISVPLFTEYEDVLAHPQLQQPCSPGLQEQQALFDLMVMLTVKSCEFCKNGSRVSHLSGSATIEWGSWKGKAIGDRAEAGTPAVLFLHYPRSAIRFPNVFPRPHLHVSRP